LRTSGNAQAGLDQLRPRGAVDRAVHAAAPQEGLVRRVHDRADHQARDVAFHHFDRHWTVSRLRAVPTVSPPFTVRKGATARNTRRSAP
jgi:hypothetical protein